MMPAESKLDRFVAKYRDDHRHPVNHLLHVGVGWLYELSRGAIVVSEVPGFPHALIVFRLGELFFGYHAQAPGVVRFIAGGGECRLRLPGMQSDRHPDRALYLTRIPEDSQPWR